jgi:phytoene dehydrogenase-like protein
VEACVTEEVFPGCKVSTAAYLTGLLQPEVIRELELSRFGYQALAGDPPSFTPFPDGRSCPLAGSVAPCEIAKPRRDSAPIPSMCPGSTG